MLPAALFAGGCAFRAATSKRQQSQGEALPDHKDLARLGVLLATDELTLGDPSVYALRNDGAVEPAIPTGVDVGRLEDLLTPTVVYLEMESLDILVYRPEVGVDAIYAVNARDVSSGREGVREDDEATSTSLDKALLDGVGLTSVVVPYFEADGIEALTLV